MPLPAQACIPSMCRDRDRFAYSSYPYLFGKRQIKFLLDDYLTTGGGVQGARSTITYCRQRLLPLPSAPLHNAMDPPGSPILVPLVPPFWFFWSPPWFPWPPLLTAA